MTTEVLDLEQRPPTSHRFTDLTGKELKGLHVVEHVGFRGTNSVWNVRCPKCAREFHCYGIELKYESQRCRRCQCERLSEESRVKRAIWRKFMNYHADSTDPAWKDFATFDRDTGSLPSPQHIVGRVDIGLPFGPTNFVWRKSPGLGGGIGRRSCTMIEHRGRRLSIAGWAREIGITREALRCRLERHDVAKALEAPANTRAIDPSLVPEKKPKPPKSDRGRGRPAVYDPIVDLAENSLGQPVFIPYDSYSKPTDVARAGVASRAKTRGFKVRTRAADGGFLLTLQPSQHWLETV